MVFGRKRRRIVRLLIVEDEPLVAFDTEYQLADGGFEIVATVDRVADALAVMAQGKEIDLVLADIDLADGTGLDVARAAGLRAIPVLFVTGACPPEAEALASGWLSKPYGTRDLTAAIAAIEATLEGRRPRRLRSGFRLFDQAGTTDPISDRG